MDDSDDDLTFLKKKGTLDQDAFDEPIVDDDDLSFRKFKRSHYVSPIPTKERVFLNSLHN